MNKARETADGRILKPDSGELRERIRALCFVKWELSLYLDTHPDCVTALDYFHQTNEALDSLIREYETAYGPLTVSGVRGESWSWVDLPWPWQRSGDYQQTREKK